MRRHLIGMFYLLGVFSFTLRGSDCGCKFIRGDPNNDGIINIADAVFLYGYYQDPETYNPCNDDSADVNDDGTFNLADPVYLQMYLNGGDPPPPPCCNSPGCDPTQDSIEPCCTPDIQPDLTILHAAVDVYEPPTEGCVMWDHHSSTVGGQQPSEVTLDVWNNDVCNHPCSITYWTVTYYIDDSTSGVRASAFKNRDGCLSLRADYELAASFVTDAYDCRCDSDNRMDFFLLDEKENVVFKFRNVVTNEEVFEFPTGGYTTDFYPDYQYHKAYTYEYCKLYEDSLDTYGSGFSELDSVSNINDDHCWKLVQVIVGYDKGLEQIFDVRADYSDPNNPVYYDLQKYEEIAEGEEEGFSVNLVSLSYKR